MGIDIDIKKQAGDFQLNFRYQGDHAVTGILGASGCGKSMTLQSIAGIVTPDQGKIRLMNTVLFDSEKKINKKPQDRRVGYLFQNYALFPTMTVEQNVMAGLKGPKAEKRKIAMNMLSRFGLDHLHTHLPGQLSGGQQQRVALARILVTRPGALLLDEPFSALDGSLKERLRVEMAQLLQEYEGFSMLVTHDREEAYQLCDRLILMDKGRIIGAGATSEIFENPGTVQAAKLTGCKNISRIQRIGKHKLQALDWDNFEFYTEAEVTDEITHIGIRAHDFYPLTEWEALMEKKRGINSVIPVMDPVAMELPFEWYITLRQKITWKCPKDIHMHDAGSSIPYALGVRPVSVMLLRED